MVPAAPAGDPLVKSRDELRTVGRQYSPGVFISADACRQLYGELLEVFAEDIGFKVCVIMGLHGPAGKLAMEIAGESREVKGMKVLPAGSLTHNRDVLDEEYGKLGVARVRHRGVWELAMLMASGAEFVDPGKIKGDPQGPHEKRVS